MEMLVGPDGRVWNPYGLEFVKHLGYFGGDTNLVSYATRNLGFARVGIYPRYSRVCFKPSSFPSRCLHRVMEILLHEDPPRVVVEQIGLLFAPLEVIANLDDAFARLSALQQATPDDSPPGSPNIIGLSLDRLDGRSKRAKLARALKAWKGARGYLARAESGDISRHPAFAGGTLAWLPNPDKCLIEAWPETYQRLKDNTFEQYMGRDVREHPDAEYVLPTTRAYFTAIHQQAPRLELIEARAVHQDGSRYWARYERLLLPWRTNSSDNFVTSVPLVRMIRQC